MLAYLSILDPESELNSFPDSDGLETDAARLVSAAPALRSLEVRAGEHGSYRTIPVGQDRGQRARLFDGHQYWGHFYRGAAKHYLEQTEWVLEYV